MNLEEKKKNYDSILLNLCLTKDDKIESVLYKLIPLLLNEILTSEVGLRKKLIEIISSCILRCKSVEKIKIPFLKIIEDYFQNIKKESNSRILYNSTLSIFIDISFKNVTDEEKIKFQQTVIENMDKLIINKEMCIYMIIKFVECLEILNDNNNKQIMIEYISKYSQDTNNKIINFVKYINEFLLIPIYCKNMNEIKFLDADVIKIYIEKLFKNKNYSVDNHIKMKKNLLNFLGNIMKNDNITFSSYIICSNEKFDEIKDFANSLIQSRRRFLDFNNKPFIDLNIDIIKHFDNNIYSFNYIIKILDLFQNSSILANDDKYLHLILSYIYFFFFFYNNENNIDFLSEFNEFQTLFNEERKFSRFLSENKYTIKLKNLDMIKCLFGLVLSILGNTKGKYLQIYNNYIFHLIFCHLKKKDEDNNYNNIINIAIIIEKFFELNEEKITVAVLNKSFILADIFFDKLKKYQKNSNDSYIIYNNILKVLSALEKYYKNIVNIKNRESETYMIYKRVSITDNNIENIISLENFENNNEQMNKYEKCKNIKEILVQNIVNILDRYVIFSDNTLLIKEILKWSINIFDHTSCEFKYYSLLYENSSDVILSDLAKDYLNLYKETKLPFDDYIFTISKKLFNVKERDIIYFFSNSFINEETNEENMYKDQINGIKSDIDYTTVHNNFLLINDIESLIEYSDINYINFDIQKLCNLIKYIDNLNFSYFIYMESINYTLLIMDIFLMQTINFENNSKNSYLLLYSTIFLLIIKKLKTFFNNLKKIENLENFKEKVLIDNEIVYCNICVLMKKRLHLILNNLLYNENHKLIKKTSKLLTKIYLLPKKNNYILVDDLINLLISANFEKVNENNKKTIHMICSLTFFFGYLIKKENVFDGKYYGILKKITNYFLHIYVNYIVEYKNFENIIFKYCINFFYLTYFSKNFLHNWINIIRESSYEKLKNSSDESINIYHYIARIFMKILEYTKGNVDTNFSLIKKVLNFLSCFPTLKDNNINALLKEDIKCSLYLENFRIQKMYAHYISHIFLRLDKRNANNLSSDFLKYIFDNSISSSKCDNIETRNKSLCLIMFYIIYYNPFLEYIKEHAIEIEEFFISGIRMNSDIYSEYCFLGLSTLFFSLSIQHNMNINDIHSLEENFKILKKKQNNNDEKHIVRIHSINNNEKTNTNILKLIVFKNENTNNHSENEKNIMSSIYEKRCIKSIDFKFFKKGKSDVNDSSVPYTKDIDETEQAYKNLDKNIYNNMYIRKVDKSVIEKYVKIIYNFFHDIDDNSFYKKFFRKKEKDVDDNFINEVKRFECKKEYVLKNIYEYISNERNYDLFTHYFCLSRYCFNYIYIFLFIQYSDLIIFNSEKKIKDFFFFPDCIYDNNYEISHLLNKISCVFDSFGENKKLSCYFSPFFNDIDNTIDFKKINKRLCIFTKYIYKILLINEIKLRNEIIKLEIFQFIQIKDISKTMTKIEKDFLKMNYKLSESIYGINALNIELKNFLLSNNEIINEAVLRFLVEFLNKMNLVIFLQESFYFLFFICNIIDSSMMDMKACINFLSVFRKNCIKFSNAFEELSIEDKLITNISLNSQENMTTYKDISKHVNEDINKSNYKDMRRIDYKEISKNSFIEINKDYSDEINKDNSSVINKNDFDEVNENNLDNIWKDKFDDINKINMVIYRLLEYHKKKRGNKRIELYLIDCLNSCIISCSNITFNLKILLEFYIENSERIENNYNEFKINNNKDDVKIYMEKDIYFGKLIKYNHSDKQKEVIEKIINNYKYTTDIEKTIKSIIFLLYECNDKFVLSNISFIIIKLLEKYETLSGDNIFIIYNLRIYVFDIISEFITKNIYKNNLVHINDLLFYLIDNVPFYNFIKFVNCNLLKDYFELDLTFGDIQNIRNYASNIIFYLLKKNLLLDLEDKYVFRDKKKVDSIRIYEEMKIINNINNNIRKLFKGDNFKTKIEKSYTHLGNMKEEIFNSELNNKLFLKLIDDIKKDFEIIITKIVSYVNKNNNLIKDEMIENMMKREIEKITNLLSHKDSTHIPHVNNIVNLIINEFMTILKEEFNKKIVFEEENKNLLKKIESKLITRSFIIMNIKNCENKYKNVYEILQKRNIFHFYKFFNEYIEEFHIFMDSKFLKDKKACLISLDCFIESFIDVYKCDNYDELDSENIHNFLNLYMKLKNSLKTYFNDDIINYFVVLFFLKSINFILLLILRKRNIKEEFSYVKVDMNIFEKEKDFNLCEIYDIFDDILDTFIRVREYEIFQYMYLFLFNIPSIFIRKFNFIKLYKCIVFFIKNYFKKNYDMSNYDNSFYLHFSKLSVCIFSYFLVKNDFNLWLNFYNFQFLNKYIKMDYLYNYVFEINQINNQEDMFNHINSFKNINNSFNNQIKVNTEDNYNLNNNIPSKDNFKYINNGTSNNINENGNDDNNESACDDIEKNKILEINKTMYLDIQKEFFDYLRTFLFVLFENCIDNYNTLSVIKTFFQFLFYNKIYFFEIGTTNTWEKIYNYLYLSIIKSKTKKVFEQLMHILNVLLCMYNSYSHKNENDRRIHLDIKINEFYTCYGKHKDNNNISFNFTFIMFFKIRDKSKVFTFPDHIIRNLKYSIMLNFPHFFL